MTYAFQDINKMSKQELTKKIHIFVRDHLCEILMDNSYTSEMYVRNKKEEVEIIRQHKLIKMLSEEDKQEVYDKCDKAIKMIEDYGKYVYNES